VKTERKINLSIAIFQFPKPEVLQATLLILECWPTRDQRL
jgi:hypothetical protein